MHDSDLSGPDLTGTVIVLTGASRGLGAGMATWFAARGAALGLCARTEPQAPPSPGATCTAALDVVDGPGLTAFARRVTGELGPIDLWINNAGVLEPIVAQRHLSASALAQHLAINVGGVLNGTQAFLAALDESATRGALVNVSSGAATAGRAGWSAYCAGKAAVDRLSEAVALEEAERLRLVASVYPGLIDTDMQALIRSQPVSVQPDVAWFRQRHEDGKMNDPNWVASVIASWVFGPEAPKTVVCRVPDQP